MLYVCANMATVGVKALNMIAVDVFLFPVTFYTVVHNICSQQFSNELASILQVFAEHEAVYRLHVAMT